jgi:hypothetical protein
VIDSSSGGGFGIGEARFDAACLREAEFLCFPDPVRIGDSICIGDVFWEAEPFWAGEPASLGEPIWEGEPPGEPSFIC